MKQYELAAAIDVTPSYLSQIERDRQRPSLLLLNKIAVIFEGTLSEIFFDAIRRSGKIPPNIVKAKPVVDLIFEYLLCSHPEE